MWFSYKICPFLHTILTWDVLFSKFDVNIIIPRLSRTVGHSARPVLHILTVDIHFARTLDGQRQTSVA